MDFLSRFANGLFEFLFPKSEHILALEELSPDEMLRTLPRSAPLGSRDTLAIFSYEHPVVREMIWELKYRGNRVVADKLGTILFDMLEEELSDRALFENFGNAVLIPMPISDKRRNERGYNQTELISEAIKKLDTAHHYKYVKGQLVKHRHTDPQTLAATKAERLANLGHTMHVVHPPAVAGKCIVLLDDVTTTGATFKEGKRALLEAGAKSILCVAVAH